MTAEASGVVMALKLDDWVQGKAGTELVESFLQVAPNAERAGGPGCHGCGSHGKAGLLRLGGAGHSNVPAVPTQPQEEPELTRAPVMRSPAFPTFTEGASFPSRPSPRTSPRRMTGAAVRTGP